MITLNNKKNIAFLSITKGIDLSGKCVNDIQTQRKEKKLEKEKKAHQKKLDQLEKLEAKRQKLIDSIKEDIGKEALEEDEFVQEVGSILESKCIKCKKTYLFLKYLLGLESE